MILSDWDISIAIGRGLIKIDPLNENDIRTNSVDVHLSDTIVMYKSQVIDAKIDNPVFPTIIPKQGLTLTPGILYLGSTIEYTEAHEHVPFLEGKSSVGRLGISVHSTAGVGDVGFCGHWTLEISVVQPVRVYAGMPIAQILFFEVSSKPVRIYGGTGSKYQQQGAKPVPSMMWKNFLK